jgi:hypothetical protein
MPANNRADEYWRNAEGYFYHSQQRDQFVNAAQEKAQNAEIDKTARIKALRLAEERVPDGVERDSSEG